MRSRRRDEVFFLGLLGVAVPRRVLDVDEEGAGDGDGGHVISFFLLEFEGPRWHCAAAASARDEEELDSALVLRLDRRRLDCVVGPFSSSSEEPKGLRPSRRRS
jgi:hypothetical protein